MSRVTPDSSRPGLRRASVGELLLAIPGVQVQERANPSQDPRLSIRGFGSRSAFGVRGVRVLRDGIPLSLPDGRPVELVDLPGAYSLDPSSPDEEVTRDVVLGRQQGERLPDALLIVLDASNLDNHLRFALQVIALGIPTVVALNMLDMAARDGLTIDPAVRNNGEKPCVLSLVPF